MRSWIFTFVSLMATTAAAAEALKGEPTTVTVPGEGWQIEFCSPALTHYAGNRKREDFEFRAAGEKGFNLSIFVEKAKVAEDRHEDCFEKYWPLAKRNPMIDQKSVVVTKTDDYVRVAYNIVVEGQEDQMKVANVNYYFAHEGRWADVHVSVFPPAVDEAEILRQFEKSLSRRPNPTVER